MRKFKLLKDLPDCPSVAIVTEGSGSVMWRTVRKKPTYPQDTYNVQFALWHVLANPDWFEEVVEERLSYYSCCDTAYRKGERCPIHSSKPTPKEEEEVLKAWPGALMPHALGCKSTPKKIELIDYNKQTEMIDALGEHGLMVTTINEIITVLNEMRGL